MLKSLEIRNFKSHKDTKLHFSDGVNVILGRSQAGKTNVLRALLLLSRNRPAGADYFSNFAGQKGTTKISTILDDNSNISLSKQVRINKKGNKVVSEAKYTINKGALGVNNFEGFGASVPDQIQEKLNLSELNIQEQFDTPFLVMASAGEIARTINRITKLEKVDQWVSKLTTRINQTNSQSKLLEEQIDESQKTLRKYSDINDAEECIKNVVRLTKQIKYLKMREAKIKETTRQVNKTNETIKQIQKALEIEKTVDEITNTDNKISRLIMMENKLFELIDLEKFIKQTTKTFLQLKIITKVITKMSESIIERIDLKYNLLQYIKAEKGWLSTKTEYKETKNQYLTLCEKFGKCPICWRPIDKNCIKRIEKEL